MHKKAEVQNDQSVPQANFQVIHTYNLYSTYYVPEPFWMSYITSIFSNFMKQTIIIPTLQIDLKHRKATEKGAEVWLRPRQLHPDTILLKYHTQLHLFIIIPFSLRSL